MLRWFLLVNDQSLWAGFGLRFPVSKKREGVREKADEERERVTGPRLPLFSFLWLRVEGNNNNLRSLPCYYLRATDTESLTVGKNKGKWTSFGKF